MSHTPPPPSDRAPSAGGTSREERRRRLRAAQAGQPVPRATVGVAHEQRRLTIEAKEARQKKIRNVVILVLSVLMALGLLAEMIIAAMPAGAEGEFTVKSQNYTNRFPEGIDFSLEASSAAPLKSATLQYTVDSGNGVISTYLKPEEFAGGTDIKTKVFHNNKKSYLPPGTRVAYQWEVEDAQGRKFKTDLVKFMQDDPRFKWKSLSKGGVTAYWYAGDEAFGASIVETTLEAIERLSKGLGIAYDKPMMVWAYNSKQEMDPALTPRGGAYDQQIVTLGQRTTAEVMLLLGNHRQYKDTIAHETGHMVVHQLAEGPFSRLPSWLDEGLAMNAQPTVEQGYFREIEQAKRNNKLMSIRAMSGVANDPQGVDLFYGQSYSVVKFLTDAYGQPKMVELLNMLKGGASIDEGLAKVYQLDQDTLDDAWRKSIGAEPRPADQRGRIEVTPIAVPSVAAFSLPQSLAPAAAGQTGGAPSSTATVAAGGGSMLFYAGAGLVGLGVLAAAVMVVQGMLKKGSAGN